MGIEHGAFSNWGLKDKVVKGLREMFLNEKTILGNTNDFISYQTS